MLSWGEETHSKETGIVVVMMNTLTSRIPCSDSGMVLLRRKRTAQSWCVLVTLHFSKPNF